jgi:hypothetical protein
MELRVFIKEALKDIVGAVEDAQNEISKGEIVPYSNSSFKGIETGAADIQPIEFEVTVTANEKEGSEAKLSVIAAVIGGNVKGQSDTTVGHVGSLKFRIPVKLPMKNDS